MPSLESTAGARSTRASAAFERPELEVVAKYRLDISKPHDPFKGLPLTPPRVIVQTCPLCQGEGWIAEVAA